MLSITESFTRGSQVPEEGTNGRLLDKVKIVLGRLLFLLLRGARSGVGGIKLTTAEPKLSKGAVERNHAITSSRLPWSVSS